MKHISIIPLFVFVSTLLGCVETHHDTAALPPPEPQYLTHQVRFRGETLGLIANWYTGSTGNWQVIKDANPTLNELNIQIGDSIDIPEEIVIRTSPLPQQMVYAALSANPKADGAELSDEDDGSEQGGDLSDPDGTQVVSEQAEQKQAEETAPAFGIASFFRRAGQGQTPPQVEKSAADQGTQVKSQVEKAARPEIVEDAPNAALAGGVDTNSPSADEALHQAVRDVEQQAQQAQNAATDASQAALKQAAEASDDAVKSRDQYLAEMLEEGRD